MVNTYATTIDTYDQLLSFIKESNIVVIRITHLELPRFNLVLKQSLKLKYGERVQCGLIAGLKLSLTIPKNSIVVHQWISELNLSGHTLPAGYYLFVNGQVQT